MPLDGKDHIDKSSERDPASGDLRDGDRAATDPGSSEADYYLTPDGLLVFTRAYHLRRGHCCKSGCRHCPYGFERKK